MSEVPVVFGFVSACEGDRSAQAALCVGQALAAQGSSCLLIDCCSGAGMLDLLTGARELTVWNIGDAAGENAACEPEDCVYCLSEQAGDPEPEERRQPGLYLAPAAETAEGASPSELAALIAHFTQEFDFLVLSLPSARSERGELYALCSELVICCTPCALSVSRGEQLRCAAEHHVPRVRLLITGLTAEELAGSGLSDLDECIDRVGAQLLGILSEEAGCGERLAGRLCGGRIELPRVILGIKTV